MQDDTGGLAQMLTQCWSRLERGVADRRAPARHPVLATRGRDGGGEARVVVLRGAERGAGVLVVHTDSRSEKAEEVAGDPAATLLVWEPKPRLQIRAKTQVTARPGTPEEWGRIPQQARAAYGGAPAPGTAIPAADAYSLDPDPERFLILRCIVQQIDVLYLGAEGHRRALFAREDGWAGRWLAP